jgi:hypothetical protein
MTTQADDENVSAVKKFARESTFQWNDINGTSPAKLIHINDN